MCIYVYVFLFLVEYRLLYSKHLCSLSLANVVRRENYSICSSPGLLDLQNLTVLECDGFYSCFRKEVKYIIYCFSV